MSLQYDRMYQTDVCVNAFLSCHVYPLALVPFYVDITRGSVAMSRLAPVLLICG